MSGSFRRILGCPPCRALRWRSICDADQCASSFALPHPAPPYVGDGSFATDAVDVGYRRMSASLRKRTSAPTVLADRMRSNINCVETTAALACAAVSEFTQRRRSFQSYGYSPGKDFSINTRNAME